MSVRIKADYFGYIDNQLVSKMAAHFGSLKLSKYALKFSAY